MVTSTLPVVSITQLALADASSRNLNTIRCSSRWVPSSTKMEDAVITPDAGLYFLVHSHALGRRRPRFCRGRAASTVKCRRPNRLSPAAWLFLASISVFATALIFVGGAVLRESFELGLALAAIGAGWLGILYASLTSLASQVRRGTGEERP